MNKHTSYDLAQMQSLPLDYKITMTKRRIKAWYEHWDGQVYVSISGGKDSQVLAHIVKSMYKDVPLVFVNTGLEYDSVRLKGLKLADVSIKPQMDFYSVLKKYGYPVISKEVSNAISATKKYVEKLGLKGADKAEQIKNKIYSGEIDINTVPIRLCQLLGFAGINGEKSTELPKEKKSLYNKEKYIYLLDAPFRIDSYCCNAMKKNTAHKYTRTTGRYPIIGTMADESRLRRTRWIKKGCNAFEGKNPSSQPLSFWTEQDILHYVKQNNIDIAEIYGDIVYTDEDGMFYDNEYFNDYMPLTTTGVNRTGCVFCMFGITQDTDRFLKLKEAEPKKYDFVMRGGKFDEQGMWIPHNGLGYKFVIDWLNEHGNLGIKY